VRLPLRFSRPFVCCVVVVCSLPCVTFGCYVATVAFDTFVYVRFVVRFYVRVLRLVLDVCGLLPFHRLRCHVCWFSAFPVPLVGFVGRSPFFTLFICSRYVAVTVCSFVVSPFVWCGSVPRSAGWFVCGYVHGCWLRLLRLGGFRSAGFVAIITFVLPFLVAAPFAGALRFAATTTFVTFPLLVGSF